MDEQQRKAFEQAVERKKEESERRSHAPSTPRGGPAPDDPAAASMQANEQQLIADEQVQDTFSVRDKNTGHGKKTADKWNQ
jgi:hypothetical protein